MTKIIVSKYDQNASIRGQYAQRFEDLALSFFEETGVQIQTVQLDWTQEDVPKDKIINDRGEKEISMNVKTTSIAMS